MVDVVSLCVALGGIIISVLSHIRHSKSTCSKCCEVDIDGQSNANTTPTERVTLHFDRVDTSTNVNVRSNPIDIQMNNKDKTRLLNT